MKLILDAGGVLVYPAYGKWCYGAGMMASRAAHTFDTDAFFRAHEACLPLVREDVRIDTEAEEIPLRAQYLACMNGRMGWGFSDAEIHALAVDYVENTARLGLYDDLGDYLPAWQERYGLGLLSDTMPSLRRVLENGGVWQYFDAHVFSTDVGALKPDPRMYAAIAQKLGADPADCLFVDDLPRNLIGAADAGMRAVQMARGGDVERWGGDVVRDFRELDEYAEALLLSARR